MSTLETSWVGLLSGETRPPHDEGYLHGLLILPALVHEPVLASLGSRYLR